jgi:spermidine synthase
VLRWELLDSTPVPGENKELRLYRRGDVYAIRVDGVELMNSRVHGSENALADLACARLPRSKDVRVLIGGLGMGFTAAAALRQLPAHARIEIVECVPAVIAWNRGPLAHLAGRPLEDGRVRVREADVAQVLRTERTSLDAFLLDVDNSPNGLTRPGNSWLYAPPGLKAAFDALRPGGVFAIWSVAPDAEFTRLLRRAQFQVKEHHPRSRGAGGGGRRTIWLAVKSECSAGGPLTRLR